VPFQNTLKLGHYRGIYNLGTLTVTSETITVPSNGATLYVRLRQLINGMWQSSDYIYTVPW